MGNIIIILIVSFNLYAFFKKQVNLLENKWQNQCTRSAQHAIQNYKIQQSHCTVHQKNQWKTKMQSYIHHSHVSIWFSLICTPWRHLTPREDPPPTKRAFFSTSRTMPHISLTPHPPSIVAIGKKFTFLQISSWTWVLWLKE